MNYNRQGSQILLVLLIFSFIAGVVSQYVRIKDHKENDHWVYYRTSQRIESKSVNILYDKQDGALPFRYSPPTLMLFSWMSHFNEITSRRIWLVVQAFFILLSYFLIYEILVKINSPSPLRSISFSFFLFYRYFLDSLYCGQVSGIVFFFFSLSLYFWVKGKKNLSNLGILALSLLKIVPAFLFMINFLDTKKRKDFIKLFTHLFLVTALIFVIYFIWFLLKFGSENLSSFFPMFKSWIDICLADHIYFDGSTSKSQSLRAVLLRVFGNSENIEDLWKITSLLSLFSIYYFWFKCRYTSVKMRLYSYLFGILSFVILMPESLTYKILKFLKPFIFLMDDLLKTSKKSLLVFFFFILVFCSLSTADLIGRSFADNIQTFSFPFITFVMMGLLMAREIYLLSHQK